MNPYTVGTVDQQSLQVDPLNIDWLLQDQQQLLSLNQNSGSLLNPALSLSKFSRPVDSQSNTPGESEPLLLLDQSDSRRPSNLRGVQNTQRKTGESNLPQKSFHSKQQKQNRHRKPSSIKLTSASVNTTATHLLAEDAHTHSTDSFSVLPPFSWSLSPPPSPPPSSGSSSSISSRSSTNGGAGNKSGTPAHHRRPHPLPAPVIWVPLVIGAPSRKTLLFSSNNNTGRRTSHRKAPTKTLKIAPETRLVFQRQRAKNSRPVSPDFGSSASTPSPVDFASSEKKSSTASSSSTSSSSSDSSGFHPPPPSISSSSSIFVRRRLRAMLLKNRS